MFKRYKSIFTHSHPTWNIHRIWHKQFTQLQFGGFFAGSGRKTESRELITSGLIGISVSV